MGQAHHRKCAHPQPEGRGTRYGCTPFQASVGQQKGPGTGILSRQADALPETRTTLSLQAPGRAERTRRQCRSRSPAAEHHRSLSGTAKTLVRVPVLLIGNAGSWPVSLSGTSFFAEHALYPGHGSIPLFCPLSVPFFAGLTVPGVMPWPTSFSCPAHASRHCPR